MAIQFSCPCGNNMRVRDVLSGKRVRCPECGNALQVPSASADESAAVRDDRPSRLPPRKRHKGRLASSQQGQDPSAAKRQLRPGSRFVIDANTLRVVVLVLIGMDAVQTGIWTLPAVSGFVELVGSFSGLTTLAAIAAHIGLMIGGIGILTGREWGRTAAVWSSMTLLVLFAVGLMGILFNAGTISTLGVVWIGRLLLREVAIPVGILACLFHRQWR